MADKSIRYLKGVGEKRAEYFEKLGISTVNDLIAMLPRRYEDIGNVVDISELPKYRGQKISVIAEITHPVKETRLKGGNILTTVYAEDLSGITRIVYFNNKYIKNSLKQGQTYLFYGKIAQSGDAGFTNPEVYSPDIKDGGGILPIYPLVSGLSQNFMRKTMDTALLQAEFTDPLPEKLREKYRLLEYKDAIFGIHKPVTWEQVNHSRRRLIFEELLYYSLGLRLLRHREKQKASIIISDFPEDFLNVHNFKPTFAQSRALQEIYKDLESGKVMNRLLQGDVGSGKTLVAGQCAYVVIKSGAQAAIMVPTEVLANQHYDYFSKMLSKLDIKVGLLTSSLSASEKREIKKQVKNGDIKLLISTHAVIQKDVEFENLGLVITDEQHRFGVMQRSDFASKGENPHILVMSATPIPRTLALMLWGDLDLSVIDVMPEGRQKVSTYLVDSNYKERLHSFIKKNTESGGRVYVVCPMIEDSEENDISGAKERFSQLCEIFGKENCGLVYGKMKAAEKDKVMKAFASGEISILVSTTVIEVGVNVPEATLMIIENAERFGLSQLHQLRGRVGRGNKKSYCVLISDNKSESTNERLDFFTKTTDGFKIANKDLELRGPGNFFGKDQHGLATMQIADMQNDINDLKDASYCATLLIEKDACLNSFPLIKERVLKLFDVKGEIFN